MSQERAVGARRMHLPRTTLEFVLRKLVEDRFRRTQEIALLRQQNEELRILLRSALWEMAQQNGQKSPAQWVSRWMADRKKREV